MLRLEGSTHFRQRLVLSTLSRVRPALDPTCFASASEFWRLV